MRSLSSSLHPTLRSPADMRRNGVGVADLPLVILKSGFPGGNHRGFPNPAIGHHGNPQPPAFPCGLKGIFRATGVQHTTISQDWTNGATVHPYQKSDRHPSPSPAAPRDGGCFFFNFRFNGPTEGPDDFNIRTAGFESAAFQETRLPIVFRPKLSRQDEIIIGGGDRQRLYNPPRRPEKNQNKPRFASVDKTKQGRAALQ